MIPGDLEADVVRGLIVAAGRPKLTDERVREARRVTFMACLALSAVLIPIASAAALAQMQCYRGPSGLNSALFVLLAVKLIRTKRSRDLVISTAAAAGLGALHARGRI